MRDSVARGVGRGSLSPGCEISGLARNDDEPGQSNAYAIFALRISQRCETNEWVDGMETTQTLPNIERSLFVYPYDGEEDPSSTPVVS